MNLRIRVWTGVVDPCWVVHTCGAFGSVEHGPTESQCNAGSDVNGLAEIKVSRTALYLRSEYIGSVGI